MAQDLPALFIRYCNRSWLLWQEEIVTRVFRCSAFPVRTLTSRAKTFSFRSKSCLFPSETPP